MNFYFLSPVAAPVVSIRFPSFGHSQRDKIASEVQWTLASVPLMCQDLGRDCAVFHNTLMRCSTLYMLSTNFKAEL